MTRREILLKSGLLAAGLQTGIISMYASTKKQPLKIGACDWSLGLSADVAAIECASRIGLNGIQVNLGNLANNMHLRQPTIQKEYLEASKKYKVRFSSLAIGELNNIPYKSDPRTDQWVADSIDVATAFGVQTVLLAFFSKNDLRHDETGKKEVIRKLKEVAPKAEKAGVILGIESYLTAEEHMDIIQSVGSPAIKVFYDFRNAADAGNDVIKEIKWLGKNMICELHIKENGVLLGHGDMDWSTIFETLLDMNYKGDGWMQIEWSVPKNADIVSSYQQNVQFLKRSFQ